MKLLSLLAVAVLLITNSSCKSSEKNAATKNVYKARLDIKGICANYTLTLLSGEPVPDVVTDWTDDDTRKTYHNAFGLGNPCNFPDSIQEGNEFYFVIDTTARKDCNVCMAYRPTPPKKLMIKVVPQP